MNYAPEIPVFEFVGGESFNDLNVLVHVGDHVEGYLDEDGTFRIYVVRRGRVFGPLINPSWVKPLTASAEAMLAGAS